MQFGGQRTSMDLKPIGKPDNILVKLTDDILPEPDAVLVHGISPQRANADGLSEAEFTKYLSDKVFLPNTIFVGFNSVRFDDEFMRFTLWRNFTDAYEWQWKNSSGRWDILDVARMTRALRPDGIKWPFDPDGKPSNRLGLLSSINKLEHSDAHDALSDVRATIAVAKLIKQKQPKLFEYLLKIHNKTKVAALVGKGEPFIYTSGYYPSEYEKTTIAVMVAAHPLKQAAIVYDLRVDPNEFTKLAPAELALAWQARGKDVPYFPVKTLSYNRCPAVAPLSVLDSSSAARLKIDSKIIDANLAKLSKTKDFGDKLIRAVEIIQPKTQPEMVVDSQKVDGQLYEGFVNGLDKTKMSVIRAADEDKLADLHLDFADERLQALLPLYKARNFPQSLSADEQKSWEDFRRQRLLAGDDSSRAAYYFKRISELSSQPNLSNQVKYLLEELNLYGQLVVPEA
jgi:exodeoxyribonuclease-1